MSSYLIYSWPLSIVTALLCSLWKSFSVQHVHHVGHLSYQMSMILQTCSIPLKAVAAVASACQTSILTQTVKLEDTGFLRNHPWRLKSC